MESCKKVIGIGLHKTGTSSLGRALTILGYNVAGSFGVCDPNIGVNILQRGSEILDQHDAVQDHPWPFIYKELDKRYPHSMFILTIRSTDSWIKSVVNYFGERHTPMREWIYGFGSPVGHEDKYISIYEKHNKDVLEYFRDRPNDLLVFRIIDGDGWDKLCSFLGKEIPQAGFPHSTKAPKWKIPLLLFRKLKNKLLQE